MGDKKMQGEGDYGDAGKASDTLTQAEREGRSHAKGLDQEKRDAELMEKLEKKRGK